MHCGTFDGTAFMRISAASGTSFVQATSEPRNSNILMTCLRYVRAVGFVLLALGLGFALSPIVGYRIPLFFFVAASLASAWYGGLGPGLVALITGFLLGDFFFVPPLYRFASYNLSDFVLLLIFASITSIGLAAIVNLQHSLEREKRAKQINEELDRRVKERTAELESFCYSASHDLRAPLRNIGCFAHLLNERYEARLDDDGRRMTQAIMQSTERMDSLLSGLLSLSRLSLKEMQCRQVDLTALVQKIADRLRMAEPERKVRVVVSPELTAEGDEALLSIALENLVNNAWKFTRRQEDARIEFGVEGCDGQRVYFVRDNGVGFDMAYADKMFGVFERLHPGDEFPGTGIGLAIVQRAVTRHQGRVWAESKVGEGATFFFTLPAMGAERELAA